MKELLLEESCGTMIRQEDADESCGMRDEDPNQFWTPFEKYGKLQSTGMGKMCVVKGREMYEIILETSGDTIG